MTPSDRPPYSPYPGGSPFPPGEEPIWEGVLKLFIAAGGAIDWTHVVITPGKPNIQQPVQVRCEGCGLSFIAPDEDHQFWVLPREQDTDKPGQHIYLVGSATLVIWLHRRKRAKKFIWPHVKVKYYQDNQVIGETSWSPPEEK